MITAFFPLLRYNKSVAQLFIRWCVQSGFVVIPKSSNKQRIHENCQVFDWSINDEDMKTLVCAYTCMFIVVHYIAL